MQTVCAAVYQSCWMSGPLAAGAVQVLPVVAVGRLLARHTARPLPLPLPHQPACARCCNCPFGVSPSPGSAASLQTRWLAGHALSLALGLVLEGCTVAGCMQGPALRPLAVLLSSVAVVLQAAGGRSSVVCQECSR